MNINENPRWRRVQEKRKQLEYDAEIAEGYKKVKFVDEQLRFSVSVPNKILDKYQFITRQGVSPQIFDNSLKTKNLTTKERISLGIERDGSKYTKVAPMLKQYLKIPLSNPNHPARKHQTVRSPFDSRNNQLGSQMIRRSSIAGSDKPNKSYPYGK